MRMNTTKLSFYLSLLAGVVLLTSCKRDTKVEDDPQPKNNNVMVSLSFECDGKAITKDVFDYTNDAGNNYSVNRLQFYLSEFVFKQSNGTEVTDESAIYVDYFENKGMNFTLGKIPFGEYDEIRFCIGLPPSLNVTDALPNTLDNVNMAWPVMMGGGYHFMKMEGNFNTPSSTYGYAVHLGKNAFLVRIKILQHFSFSTSNQKLNMKMNINEWFRNPHLYNLDVDGNYTMANDTLMAKIAENGTDVFTLW